MTEEQGGVLLQFIRPPAEPRRVRSWGEFLSVLMPCPECIEPGDVNVEFHLRSRELRALHVHNTPAEERIFVTVAIWDVPL